MKPSKLHIALFVATIVTTFIAGYAQGGSFASGLSFSSALIFILGSHEMGHYMYGRKYGIDITPPYFIPAPPVISPIGTFGAFIKIKSRISSKRALFDIGVAGPILGIIAVLPVLYIGLSMSRIVSVSEFGDHAGITLGSSPIFSFFVWMILGDIPAGKDVLLHPVAFAGWIGLLVTALNLIPSGQLDGGHIIYSVFGKWTHYLASNLSVVTLVIMGLGTKSLVELFEIANYDIPVPQVLLFEGWAGWLVWAFFLTLMGGNHPATTYEEYDIGIKRKIVAFVTLLLLIGCFTPSPVSFPK